MANAISGGWGNIARALSNSDYRTYQIGRFVFQITNWMYKVAVAWMVWDLTHSAAWLGVFGFLDQATSLVVMPLAGVVTDRMSSIKFMRITQALLLVHALSLGALVLTDLLSIWVLAGYTVVFGMLSAAQQPANQTIVPKIVPREDLAVAYGLHSLIFNLSRSLGPMVAGVSISFLGTGQSIMGNALGTIWFSICLMTMKTDMAPVRNRETTSRNFLVEIGDAARYAARHRGIGPSMLLMGLLSLLPITIEVMLPSLADGVYHAGAHGLAGMTTTLAIGAIVMGGFFALRGKIAGMSLYVTHGVFLLGAALICLALSTEYWIALVFVFFVGVALMSIRNACLTLLQHCVAPRLRGRVASLHGMITNGGPAVGALAVGAIADQVGLQTTLIGLGVFSLLVWIWAARTHKGRAAALEIELT